MLWASRSEMSHNLSLSSWIAQFCTCGGCVIVVFFVQYLLHISRICSGLSGFKILTNRCCPTETILKQDFLQLAVFLAAG